ncbi:glycine zipper 2TM domain-containing protein [Acidovorax soli]|uniref:Osmotically inducible lipoprotein OsmB n=1 Tax=Acidovorax soli TaxID=592050 RepID=A0A1H3WVE8_9BURK|nr:glycine zipper 2TM domain-containing protein [Acidovorax soli]SDZ90721.1 osmotically inducible lipoprotein OsmB [Acidovorax soli]
MKIRFALATSVCAVTLALGGCASKPTNAQIGTGVGAVVGGVAGNAVLGGTLGTVGGAAAGALIGNELGKDRDQSKPRR